MREVCMCMLPSMPLLPLLLLLRLLLLRCCVAVSCYLRILSRFAILIVELLLLPPPNCLPRAALRPTA